MTSLTPSIYLRKSIKCSKLVQSTQVGRFPMLPHSKPSNIIATSSGGIPNPMEEYCPFPILVACTTAVLLTVCDTVEFMRAVTMAATRPSTFSSALVDCVKPYGGDRGLCALFVASQTRSHQPSAPACCSNVCQLAEAAVAMTSRMMAGPLHDSSVAFRKRMYRV